MKFVETRDVKEWLAKAGSLSEYHRGIGSGAPDELFVEEAYGFPLHLRFAIEALAHETNRSVPVDAFDSIPFFSLAKGLFLPLSGLHPERAVQLFGFQTEPPPDAAEREALLHTFLERPLGLSLVEKLACIYGDPFRGKTSSFKRDSLVALYMSMHMVRRRDVLDRLTIVGDPAALFAEGRKNRRSEPPLSAKEVLETLRFLPTARQRTQKFEILRSLFERAGKLEAYFLVKLILRKAGFGFDYQGALVARAIAEHFEVEEGEVAHAMALTDAFNVAAVLEKDGKDGLRKIQLKPLVPVRPALAMGGVEGIEKFPIWVERKYDGIRLMVHKSTDLRGVVLGGAYTRTRGDWLELIGGLEQTIRALPVKDVILDGELYGTLIDLEGVRPASVYEIYSVLQGEKASPVNLKYAAFDLLYLNGQDLTRLPLRERRNRLGQLVLPMKNLGFGLPIAMSEGQSAESIEDLNRLYHHFRSQGYEGVITKDLEGEYRLSARDPSWTKRKPEITLDLVLLSAVLAVTTKERVGLFGSYVIGARTPNGGFQDIGDVAGVDRVRDQEIQAMIMREGLLTGRRIERPSASGVRPGMELRPHIVVTVKFEGIAKDYTTGALSLRGPKVAHLRTDKSASEADTVRDLEEVYLRQRVG